MTREERVKKLYLETYEGEDVENTPLEEMEEALEQYYLAAGFDITSIDDLFENHEVDKEFVEEVERRINETIKNEM